MLKSGVTKLGIAASYAPGTKYKVFWTIDPGIERMPDKPDLDPGDALTPRQTVATVARHLLLFPHDRS